MKTPGPVPGRSCVKTWADSGIPAGATVVITGATGFIGGAVAAQLAGAGYRVRALVRPGSVAKPRPATASDSRLRLREIADIRVVGLDQRPALVQALANADALIHCAGSVRGIHAGDFAPANVQAVENLARVCADLAPDQGPARCCLISSLAARHPHLSAYAASKQAGEAVLEGDAGHRWTILRPPAVYGPGDRELAPLLRLIRRGVVPAAANPAHRFSLLHVEDLAEALLAWLQAPATRGVYELHDGRPDGYSWRELGDLLAPRRALRFSVPAAVLDLAAVVNTLRARLVGRAPMLTRSKVRELCHPRWICDNAAFTRDTGWQPRMTLGQSATDSPAVNPETGPGSKH